MIKNKRTFFIGIFIFLIPFLGFPSSWKTFFTIVAGLFLAVSSLKITLPKRNVVKKVRRKEKVTPVFTENSPMPKIEDIVPPVVQNKEESKLE